MPSVFITGANGFIGSNLCKYFLAKGFTVHGLVRPSSDLHFLEGLAVNLVQGDLTRPDSVSFPPAIDIFIHSASLVSDTASAQRCHDEIYLMTVNLVARLRQQCPGLKKFIYISTALTLGYNKMDISEKNPGESALRLPYAQYKRNTELFLLEQFAANRFPVVIMRPTDVYGPHDRTSCFHMLEGCEHGVPLITGHGNWYFGFCYVDNLSQAVYLASQSAVSLGQAYTVSNNTLITWRQFFSGLQHGLGKKQRIYMPVTVANGAAAVMEALHALHPRFDPPINFYRIRRITHNTTYDVSKTIAELGYSPDTDTKSQIQRIVDWYLAEKSYRNRKA
jgi:nucleoside-diphosphate-sugar epimerase